ncbi:MAG: DinB family protein [Bryobacteraceae bacterium]
MLSYYHSTRKQIADSIAGLSTEQLNYKPGPDRWSVREVLEHLALTEPGIFGMAMAGLKTPVAAPESKLTDEQFIARVKDRSQKVEAPASFRPAGKWTSGEAVISEFKARRDQNLDSLRETQEDLTNTYFKSELGVMSVYQTMLLVPAHNERHLQQINEVKASEGFPKR